MQTRPYPEEDGLRIWLARSEQKVLLDVLEEEPRRRLAMQLGLHGLRADEVVQVEPQHVRTLANGGDGHVLIIPDGKTGKREVPISEDLVQRIRLLKSAARLRQDEPLIDVGKRQVRNWISAAREEIVEDDRVDGDQPWDDLGMHDLRRTWATDSYYSLAFEGVPIAEQLTMSWGGWRQTESGRTTFRENYLGPVPDHISDRAVEHLSLR